METFAVGSHVVIELMDERKIAGYIQGYTEDGLVLSATHKDAVLVRRVSEHEGGYCRSVGRKEIGVAQRGHAASGAFRRVACQSCGYDFRVAGGH